jgi:ribosomal protein L16 Arg81 hydroxylase
MGVLGQLAGSAPNVVVALLDVVFEMHPTLPNKDKVLKRVRGATGMRDEDVEVTPEEQQAQQQQQQVAQAQFEAQMAQFQASIREAEAKGEKLEAEAMAKRLESLYMAAQAAQVLSMAPQISPIADELLKSVGFKDQNGAGVIDPAAQQFSAPEQTIDQQFPDLQQADGSMAGIETQAADGIQNLTQPGEIA